MRMTTRNRSHQAGIPITNPTLENIGSKPQIDSRVQVADHSVVDVTVVSSGCCCWANEDPSSPHRMLLLRVCAVFGVESVVLWRCFGNVALKDETLSANVTHTAF